MTIIVTERRIHDFWAHVDKALPWECWNWQGYIGVEGYGRHARVRTHQFAWILRYGAIPDGTELHHVCRNKGCCNPLHLLALTKQEHMRRHYTAEGMRDDVIHLALLIPEEAVA
jgi:hypothetical protein